MIHWRKTVRGVGSHHVPCKFLDAVFVPAYTLCSVPAHLILVPVQYHSWRLARQQLLGDQLCRVLHRRDGSVEPARMHAAQPQLSAGDDNDNVTCCQQIKSTYSRPQLGAGTNRNR